MSARVLLATSADWAAGEPAHEVLDAALDVRGVDATWAVWDDPAVDWAAADLVAARSTWDYDQRLGQFLTWADSVGPRLLNGAGVFRWNTDKAYLVQLAGDGLPVVPTTSVDAAADLPAAAAAYGRAVVKPRVGAGGRGLVVVDGPGAALPTAGGPWVVQPLVESVRSEGEASVFVLDGRPTGCVRKVATAADVRVHPYHGGTSTVVALPPDAADLARDAVAATARVTGTEIAYARIDMLRLDGRLVVSEVEVTEPGLYLDLLPDTADHFADVVVSALGRR